MEFFAFIYLKLSPTQYNAVYRLFLDNNDGRQITTLAVPENVPIWNAPLCFKVVKGVPADGIRFIEVTASPITASELYHTAGYFWS